MVASGPGPIITRSPGYVVMVAEGELDLHRFERLVADAGEARERGDHQRAARCCGTRSPSGAARPSTGWKARSLRAAAARLEEMRLSALEDRIEADTHVGSLGKLAAELTELVATHPLRERLRAHLMRVLYQLGRQAEALQVYQRTYTVLREDLGIDPSPSLQQLHQAILAGDPALARHGSRRTAAAGRGAADGRHRRRRPSPDAPHQFRPRRGTWSAAPSRSARSTGALVGGQGTQAGPDRDLGAGRGRHVGAGADRAQLVAEAFPDGQLFVPMARWRRAG